MRVLTHVRYRQKRERSLQFATADLSYHLMLSHDRFHRTRPETYAHAHSHMPAWLGLIFPRRPSVKQFVRKFNSSQMVWLRPGWWETIVPCITLLSLWGTLSLSLRLIVISSDKSHGSLNSSTDCRVTLSQHEIKMNPLTVPTHILDLFANDSLEQDVLQ